jgi:hypothetical protein
MYDSYVPINPILKFLNSPTLTHKIYADWTKRYGQTFRFQGFGRVCSSLYNPRMFLSNLISMTTG